MINTNIVSAKEAINHAKIISSYEHLHDYCAVVLFMVFKDRYNPDIRYYAYYTPFDNYEDDDILINKIFNNVKNEEFIIIGMYDGNEDDTFYYNKNEILDGLDPSKPYNITDNLVDSSVYNYYNNKGIKVFGIYNNETFDYVNSIDEHKVICNKYNIPKFINMKDYKINKFANLKCCDSWDYLTCFVISRNLSNNEYILDMPYMKKFIKDDINYYSNKYIEFICVYDYDNGNAYCTDKDFINYYINLGEHYIVTHYFMDIVKEYFRQLKNIEFDFNGYERNKYETEY